MARTTVEERLAEYDRRHRELAAQIAEIGIVAAGSVTRRFTRCTSVGCRCNADPPTPHGPYWQWTAKVNGKTVTKRLTDRGSAALSGVDRQRPPHPCPARSDPQSGCQGRRTPAEGSRQRVGRRFNCKLRLA